MSAVEAISKNGFWFKIKAVAIFKPKEYLYYFEDLNLAPNAEIGPKDLFEIAYRKESGLKRLYIIKTGTTFPATLEQLGDFDTWTRTGLGETDAEIGIVDAENGAGLPPAVDCVGVVITGAHPMVTDALPWSLAIEKWLPSLLAAETPVFGICYGHQLLARAAGGEVGYHPRGKEIGTVGISCLPEAERDPLFRDLPASFRAHATHAQTVLTLPSGAVRLAANGHETNHAFRIGACAWGVQFHPEYTPEIMRAYIREQAGELAAAGLGPEHLLQAVVPTPEAGGLLRKFADLAARRGG